MDQVGWNTRSSLGTMHVCLLSNLYPPEAIGGAERHVARVASRLADRGHRVSVLTTDGPAAGSRHRFRRDHDDDVDVYRFTPYNVYVPVEHASEPFWKKPVFHAVDLWNPHVYLMVSRLLGRLSPDIVHVHNYTGLSPAVFPAAPAAAPVFHTLHDHAALSIFQNLYFRGSVREPGPAMRAYQAITKRAIEPHVDHLLAPSAYILERHRTAGLFRTTAATVLPLGVERQGVGSVSASPETRTEPFTLLYVGRVEPSKGVELLVDAVSRLELDIRLHVVGDGPDLEALAERTSDDEGIRFHGFRSEGALEHYYAEADFTVVPSRTYDNSPSVIYESYAHGTPVIGAAIGGIPELITPGETGFVFEPGDGAALAETIETARRSVDADMATTARQLGRSLTLDTHVDRLVGRYRRYVDGDADSNP